MGPLAEIAGVVPAAIVLLAVFAPPMPSAAVSARSRPSHALHIGIRLA
jgi:hypothetical protein